jgi:hypothetical protein
MSRSVQSNQLQKRLMPEWKFWVSVAALVAFFILLRWNNFNAPLIRDEGEYIYASRLLIHNVAPYEHAFLQKPPMVVYTYAFSNLLLPHVFWSARILACVFVAAATVLLGFIARVEFGKGLALPATWLMTPTVLLPDLQQFVANTEMFMLLPLLAVVAIYCYSRQHGNQPKHWFAAAFAAVTALLYKYTALPVLIFVFAVWFTEAWRTAGNRSHIFRAIAAGIAGGSIAVVLALGYFLIHDGGRHLWECTVAFNRYYAASTSFGLVYFWKMLGNFWRNWWILFLMPWAALLEPRPRMWFWLGIFLCALLATNASQYGQYYVMAVPFLALLNVAGIGALSSRLGARFAPTSRWIGCMISTVVVLLVICPEIPMVLCSPEKFAEKQFGGWSPFLESRQVAELVSKSTTPDDFIFIAGSEPQILCYAQRFSPTRFVTAYPLTIPTPMARSYQQEVIHDLQTRPPALIVLVQTPSSWLLRPETPPDFWEYLHNLLLENYEFAGGYLKDGTNGIWSPHLDERGISAASLLLYKRKLPATGALR